MQEKKHYDSSFYNKHQSGSYNAAKLILGDLFQYYKPKSVLDVGCGVGAWIKYCYESNEIEDVLGVEGDYLKKENFLLDAEKNLLKFDLKNKLDLNRKYDLVISMEVAEHIPASKAQDFIDNLTRHSDIVLFSAAIIGQDGTFHINEQYPEYWVEKFKNNDFVPIDFIRNKIWNVEELDFWYKQNTLLFVHKDSINKLHSELVKSYEKTDPNVLLRIHPQHYEKVLDRVKVDNFLHYKMYQVKKYFKERK